MVGRDRFRDATYDQDTFSSLEWTYSSCQFQSPLRVSGLLLPLLSQLLCFPRCRSHLRSPWKVNIFLTWYQSRLDDPESYSAPFATLGLSRLGILCIMLQHSTYFYLCESVYLDYLTYFLVCLILQYTRSDCIAHHWWEWQIFEMDWGQHPKGASSSGVTTSPAPIYHISEYKNSDLFPIAMEHRVRSFLHESARWWRIMWSLQYFLVHLFWSKPWIKVEMIVYNMGGAMSHSVAGVSLWKLLCPEPFKPSHPCIWEKVEETLVNLSHVPAYSLLWR